MYTIADREVVPEDGDPEVIFCVDEFGPLNLQPRPGRRWAAVGGKRREPGRVPRHRMRATYTRKARRALSGVILREVTRPSRQSGRRSR